mgnify:CR=1 FL=1
MSLMEVPVVGAPLAGGASTPELAAAVSEGGGLGFLAAGYKTIDEVRREIEHVRVRTRRPFGVNVFFPTRVAADEASLADAIRTEHAVFDLAVPGDQVLSVLEQLPAGSAVLIPRSSMFSV